MSIEVEIQEIEPQTIAVHTITTAYAQIGEDMGKGYQALAGALQKAGVYPAGPAVAIYENVDNPEAWQIKLGFPVSGSFEDNDQVESYTLPSGKVAVAWHVGPYDKLGEAWHQVDAWMKEGHEPSGEPCWEVYAVDEMSEPDSSKWKTQLLWPVK